MIKFKTIRRHIDSSLETIDRPILDGMCLADLIEYCQERGLPTEGDKACLIEGLLSWKQNTRPVPAPSTPKLITADEWPFPISSWTAEQQRREITSREFSALFLDGDTSLNIPYEELVVGDKLGSGGFKDCYAGTYKGEPVAIGFLRYNINDINLAEVKHEIKVLKQLRHDNVVQFIGVCTNPQHLCIVTELCTFGDLFDVMRKTKKPSVAQLFMYMHDIAHGVAYLHKRRPSIIHRDLKSMNILISKDKDGGPFNRAKVNDFGLARIRPKANASMHTTCGTINWQAPEFWSPAPRYTEKVDVYACGLIFWEILTWSEYGYPFQSLPEHLLYYKVRDEDFRPSLGKLAALYPKSLLLMITEMWHGDPRMRPSMNHVLETLSTYLD